MAEKYALLNSRATHNFIDKRMAKKLGIGTRPLTKPRSIINVDGTRNQEGTLTKYANLSVSHQDIMEVQQFFITNLGEDCAIFGFSWLQTFSLNINWRQAKINRKTTINTIKERPPHWVQISQIALIAHCIAKKEGLEKGEEVHVQIDKTNVAQQWAEKLLNDKKGKLMTEATIPTQYVEYSDVFSESAARQSPPQREDNHAINFKPNMPNTSSCKIYPISFKKPSSSGSGWAKTSTKILLGNQSPLLHRWHSLLRRRTATTKSSKIIVPSMNTQFPMSLYYH